MILITYDFPIIFFYFFFSSRRRHTIYWRDWSSDVCSSDLDDEEPDRESAPDDDQADDEDPLERPPLLSVAGQIGRASCRESVDLGAPRITKTKTATGTNATYMAIKYM